MNLKGKYALVTGAAKRVGKVIAQTLALESCNIVLHYRSSMEQAKETKKQLEESGVEVILFQQDLEFEQSLPDVPLDILINSASIFPRASITDTTFELLEKTLKVNLIAPFLLTKQFAFQAKGEDNLVVNILDGAGEKPWPAYAAHGVSKAALAQLTKIAARTFAPQVRVNGIVPGPVLKPENMTEEKWERIATKVPLKRAGQPEDVAQAVVFLAKNAYMTGAILHVDGGESLISR